MFSRSRGTDAFEPRIEQDVTRGRRDQKLCDFVGADI